MLFVTNNATKSRKSYKGKFDKLGVEAHVVRLDIVLSIIAASTTYFESYRMKSTDLHMPLLFIFLP